MNEDEIVPATATTHITRWVVPEEPEYAYDPSRMSRVITTVTSDLVPELD